MPWFDRPPRVRPARPGGTGGWARCLPAALVTIGLLAHGRAGAGSEQAGTAAASFLLLPGGARDASLAGAVLGWSDDLGGAASNPAALGWMSRPEIMASHFSLEGGMNREWLSAGGAVRRNSLQWGASVLYQSFGSFQGFDAFGQPTGDFTASDIAGSLLLGWRLGPTLGLGGAVKYVHEDLSQVAGSGVTADLGFQVRTGAIGFGMAAQNVGGSMSYEGARYPFPTSYGAGMAASLPHVGLQFLLDVNVPEAYHADLRAGAEWSHRGMVAARLGYRHELGGASEDPLNGPAFGVGGGANGLWLDYSFDPGPSEGEHRLTLRFTPAAWGRTAAKQTNPGHFEPESMPPAEAPRKADVPSPEPPTRKAAPLQAKPPVAKSAEPTRQQAAAGSATPKPAAVQPPGGSETAQVKPGAAPAVAPAKSGPDTTRKIVTPAEEPSKPPQVASEEKTEKKSATPVKKKQATKRLKKRGPVPYTDAEREAAERAGIKLPGQK